MNFLDSIKLGGVINLNYTIIESVKRDYCYSIVVHNYFAIYINASKNQ